MDPFSLALGAGSLVSSIMSGNQAQKLNAQIAARNANAQDTAAFNQQMLSNRMLEQQEAGSIDARGNQVRYIPGVGWVTTSSEQTKKLTGASDAEELRRLTIDTLARRRGMQANEQRRDTEGAQANATLSEMNANPNKYSEERLFNLYRQRNREGLNRGFDEESNNAMRQANRSGASNAGSIVAALAARRGEAFRQSDSQAQIDALTNSEGLKGQQDQRLGNKYNMFASRASNFDDTPFAPNQLVSQLSQNMTARQNTAPQAYGMSIQAAGNPGAILSPVQPNYTNALALGGASSLLSSILSKKGGGGSAVNEHGFVPTATRPPTRLASQGGF